MYITGTGYVHPKEIISNKELVSSFNQYVRNFNSRNQAEIESGNVIPLRESSEDFILTASGIENRYVRDKQGLLDPDELWPTLPERPDSQISMQAEEGVKAAELAIENAQINKSEIGAVILASSHKQRDYPTVSIEIQNALGLRGFAFDLGNACSSAIYGIQMAEALLAKRNLNAVLVISPEIKSGQFDPKDRDSHFIFGEATTAVVIEKNNCRKKNNCYEIADVDLFTEFSNNIRNNRGAYNNCYLDGYFSRDKLFKQNGRKVFKDIVRLVSHRIKEQLYKNNIQASDVSRFWLHQANIKINEKIVRLILNHNDIPDDIAPSTLREFGNTSSSGSVLCFAKNNKDLPVGSIGVLSSFGAGYSYGSILLKKSS